VEQVVDENDDEGVEEDDNHPDIQKPSGIKQNTTLMLAFYCS